MESALQLLQKILIDPIARQSLPCVDFIDYAAMFGGGGEFHLRHATAKTIESACEALILPETGSNRLCLHVRAPAGKSSMQALMHVLVTCPH